MKNKKESLKDNIVCVHCKSKQYKKGGFARGTQRYKCKSCNKYWTKLTQVNPPKKNTDKFCCKHCESTNYVKHGKSRGLPVHKCKDCKRTWVDTDSVRKFSKKAIECSHCKKQEALRIQSFGLIDGSTKNIYECRSCGTRTNVIVGPSQPEITDKQIAAIDKLDISYKLAEWRQGYLKRRLEPKKYEPMLYFLDYFNGVGF